ncbi:hypothetical protein AMECASPLE_018274 [Ameca splendens]|uniref:Secreted protein n=1 Tax=Ameca splendens TaxID=208324 RepID=A0ABV0ZBY9_9TELE
MICGEFFFHNSRLFFCFFFAVGPCLFVYLCFSFHPLKRLYPADDTACNWHTETLQQVTLQQLPSARRHTETPVGSMCGFCGCSSSFASELTVQKCLYGAEVVRTERTSLPAVWHDAT